MKLIERIVSVLVGENLAAASDIVHRPWVERGVRDAARTFGVAEGETDSAFVAGVLFEAGALAALRQARAILSDAAVRGHELEALKLIEDGANHADVLAKLRASKPAGDGDENNGTIILFRKR